MTEKTSRASRSDGLRNRALLLSTASRLFVEKGPEVSSVEIAKTAGVGVGTLYRHFPTRVDLIEAAYRSELDAVCAAAPQLLRDLPPEQALRAWMDAFFDYITTKIGMMEAIRAVVAVGGNPFANSRERLNEALALLMTAAVADGTIRADVSSDDVLMSLSGIGLAAKEPTQRAQAGRMIDLIFMGLRP